MVIYIGILEIEELGAKINYYGIFITLAFVRHKNTIVFTLEKVGTMVQVSVRLLQ
jgi:hypothetical protein